MEAPLKETPLWREHERLKAQKAPFAGWNMPIQYEGILAEHRWCREKAGLFDICHMGELLFRGDVVRSGFDQVFTFSVLTIPVGRSRYGFLLNDGGGIHDDLIVLRLGEEEAMVVVNAATTERDFDLVASRLKPGSELRNVSSATGKLDLQGPLSRDVLVELFGPAVPQLPPCGFVRTELLGQEAVISRTGYTGELGFELFVPVEKVAELWRLLLSDERVKPAGLGARDILRLEVGYPLYGTDLDEETTPFEAGLGAHVDLNRPFVGREALLRQQEEGLKRVRVGLRVSSRRSPRGDFGIFREGKPVGTVSSGALSPTLGCGIGIGFVAVEASAVGTRVTIAQGNVQMEAEVVDLPFYRGGSARA